MDKNTQLIGDFANTINHFGADSAEALAFLEEHKDNKELMELARLSIKLKKAMTMKKDKDV